MHRSIVVSVVLAIGGVAVAVAPALATKAPAACAPGRFLVDASQLPFSGGASLVPLVFSTSSNPKKPAVTLGLCGSGKTKLYKGSATGTKVKLFWPSCGTLKKLAVSGSIGTDCKSLALSVKAKKTQKVSASASLATGCGDGLVDAAAGETCEGTTGCAADEQCASCHCQPIPTTTTTIPVTSTTAPGGASTTTTTTSSTSTTSTTVPTLCTGGVRNDVVDGVEQCDDGNDVIDDGCTNSCTICGNGEVTPPEACDDGNLTCGDGCDAACRIEACGNGIVDCGETCDDGDLDDDNACPADCVIDACTPDTSSSRQVTVSFAPGGQSVAALVVLLDYPEGKVNILGSGSGAASSIDVLVTGTSNATNDLDHKVKEVVTKTTPFQSIAPGQLFRVDFKDCQGAQAPTVDEFPCKVLSASSPTGANVDGVTCSASIS